MWTPLLFFLSFFTIGIIISSISQLESLPFFFSSWHFLVQLSTCNFTIKSSIPLNVKLPKLNKCVPMAKESERFWEKEVRYGPFK